MTYRKTWFSGVLWILYTILCVVSLVLLVGSVWTYYFAGIPYGKEFPVAATTPLAGLSDNILLLIGLIILPVTVILYCVIRSVSKMIRKKCTWKEGTVRVWECIIVILALAGGIFLRIMYAEYVISMAGNERFLAEKVVGMEYYDMAVVTAGNIMTSSLDRISHLYVLCLQVVLSFLGNKIASAVILQILLQIIGMILAYAVTRKIAGRLPACIVLIYLACSVCCLRMLIYFGPEWLFFVLYMIGMLIVASYVQSYCANRLRKPVALFGAVVIGAVIGVLAYIDPTAASLMILIVSVATGRKKRQEIAPVYNSAGISAAVIFIVVATYIVVLFGVLYLGLYGEKFDLRNLPIWYEYKYSAGFINLRPYLYDVYSLGLLIVPAAFLVFEFFRNSREQNYMLWILLCIIVAPTPMAVAGEHQYGLLSLYIWAVLAGLGMQNCIFGGRAQVMQAVIEGINFAAEEAEKSDNLGRIEEIERPGETKEQENNQQPEEGNKEPEEIKESGRNKEPEEIKETAENKELEEAKDSGENREVQEINEPGRIKKLEETNESEENKEPEEIRKLGETNESKQMKETKGDIESGITKDPEKGQEQEKVKVQERESRESKVTGEIKKSEMPETVAEQRQQKPPRYIDNPLPLPKKHVKKEMDYQYPVEEKDMKFDLEISENDDFDIP